MPPLNRRDLLLSAAAASLMPLLPGCGSSTEALDETSAPAAGAAPAAFRHGVASGDPLATAVILWTRVTPLDDALTTLPVDWELAEDAAFSALVASGRAMAAPENDHTVKVDATGLQPGRSYCYRFRCGSVISPTGRTRTAPVGAIDRLRFALVTCAKYSSGYFNGYRRVAERADLQAVIHVGDYIYESGDTDGVRAHEPPRTVLTLTDYRARYAQHREDADLQALHRQHPMIWVWDDHEVANDAWRDGAPGHDPAVDGDYATRRAMAFRAAHEWLPIRLPAADDPARIHRGFEFGDLADLSMLDTRHYARDEQAAPNTVFGDAVPAFTQTGAFADPAREMIGAAQLDWLRARLQSRTARWRLIGNQVIFSPLKLIGGPRSLPAASVFLSNDKWDGYEPARDRVLAAMAGIDNLVVLTGDAHEAYAFDLTPDPNNLLAYRGLDGGGSLGVEFVATSITTRGDAAIGNSLGAVLTRIGADAQQLLRVTNPHLKYYQNTLNGYVLIDLTPARAQAEFWFVPKVGEPTDEESCDAVFVTEAGSNRLRRGEGPSAPIADAPPLVGG